MIKKIESVSNEIIELLCLATSRNRVEDELEDYLKQENRELYLSDLNDYLVGCIGIERQEGSEIAITHIAVLEKYHHQKIGSSMIDHLINVYKPSAISAETDREAVGFYENYGFNIESLGEKYPGVERFYCLLLC